MTDKKKVYNPKDSIFAKGLDHKLEYGIDELGNEILVKNTSKGNEQVMMEWEIPYMQSCIDELYPEGDVLEVGFGMGYSASTIQDYEPKSHTIIECHPTVLKEAHKWRKEYPDSDIRIIEGTWQEQFENLGNFDQIFFDDHGLMVDDIGFDGKYEKYMTSIMMRNNFYIFFDMAIKYHMKKGSRFVHYQNSPWTPAGYAGQFNTNKQSTKYWRSNYSNQRWYSNVVTNPLVEYYEKTITLDEPASSNCNYFFGREAVIPMITKIKNNKEVQLIDATR